MKRFELNVPTFGFAVATRAMIGAGLGLLLSDRIARKRRRAIGFTLLGIGAASTVPVVRALIRGRKDTAF
jgi:F0F1-type ATP synthase assembly protein I